jgi:ABC-type transport system involved in multi-copper enzyme maturation permease subunit
MTFLPIVQRELRVASRRASTYWLRFFAALLVLGFWIVLLMGTRRMTPAQLSQHIITMLGSLTLGFCMIAGAFLTSDSVSSEKREGTIGLLFLTDLKGFDIVLGKFVATSIHAFFGLLAALPILGLSLMMGGVTGAEFARFALVFVVTLFASLAAGILVSTFSQQAMRATAGTFLVVLFFGGILPALWWAQSTTFIKSPLFDFLLVPSPPYLFRQAFDAAYSLRTGAHEFWQSSSVIFGLALASILIACLALPRVWQTGNERKWFRAPQWLARRGSLHSNRTGLASATNPFTWLASRDFSARVISWRILMPLVGLCLIMLVASVLRGTRNIPAFIACFLTAFGLHVLLKVLIAMEAGRRINEDRQNGALELLLVSPLPIGAIIEGQRVALRAHFRRPILLLVGLNAAMIFTVLLFPGPLSMDGEDQIIFCELFLGGIVLLLADFYALGWLGMWRGLIRHNHRAVVGTVLQVMGLPWGLIVLLMSTQPRVSETGIFFLFAFWIAAGLLVDAVVITTARRNLSRHFRAAACGVYQRMRGLPGFNRI